jgi:hypothetical protein
MVTMKNKLCRVRGCSTVAFLLGIFLHQPVLSLELDVSLQQNSHQSRYLSSRYWSRLGPSTLEAEATGQN